MNLEILDQAEKDLIEGFHFYEDQSPGLGSHFLTNLFAEIESLRLYAGIHNKKYRDYHQLLSQRFPFAVYYKLRNDTAFVHPVVDCRRDPAWIRKRLL